MQRWVTSQMRTQHPEPQGCPAVAQHQRLGVQVEVEPSASRKATSPQDVAPHGDHALLATSSTATRDKQTQMWTLHCSKNQKECLLALLGT